ncbi:phosphoenolpyruvate synthase [Taibaiella sp. KBW10]|uniref:phosphoenolpyruvate synthase n=1 Tax=Taibaiella sp. KBW10 TaxID=2153357 RepID=UPI000F59C762|nr:phosphoenolpyruvate synthase [Taibaiella sp. KBW10]RQO30147.1 phosphoenolpyruvate synthase [Taibaiella sp. KBW10]
MDTYVIGFRALNKTMLASVGGKGANLGELSRIKGILVPDGFCITTDAFRKIIVLNPAINELLDSLSSLKRHDTNQIRVLSAALRKLIEETGIPQDIQEAIFRGLSESGIEKAYAIRSSATAEDLPTASFAGQQDTYLNIIGKEAIGQHIRKCWASLFTERAILYRVHNGWDHRKVQLSVIVQEMVFPDAAGIMFTADPLTGNRKVCTIDAGFGLGEAMVSGLVNVDQYKLYKGKLIEQQIALKKSGIYSLREGGTTVQELATEQQQKQVLREDQLLALEVLGRIIEAHFDGPQDIEWCLEEDTFYIVQSRPITTLYPIPKAPDDENRVYVSVGHNQMMTDALKPLGLSFFRLTTPASMLVAGSRLFVDVTAQLASPVRRAQLIETFGQSDLLIKDALKKIASRKGFIKPSPEATTQPAGYIDKTMSWSDLAPFENNPGIVTDLIQQNQNSIATLRQNIRAKSGAALFAFIREDILELKSLLFNPQSWAVIKVALYASSWINEKMYEWLGEKNAADVLSQSVPNNITSEMGLALLALADVIRPYPAIITYLQEVTTDPFLERLLLFKGGKEVYDAIDHFLNQYGMRCAGEIDITKNRWREQPSLLLPILLGHIKNHTPNAGQQKFAKGQQEAFQKEQMLLDALVRLPDGAEKAAETKRMIGLLRNFIGYREYPKYGMINRFFIYKQAMLQEAEQLVAAKIIQAPEDIYYLTFEELAEAVLSHKQDQTLIHERKEAYNRDQKRNLPRVMTSDGEIITGAYNTEHVPAGAMAGLAVSSGIVEGCARILLHMEDAVLEAGDILVTRFTDPGWTALFVSVTGLVTEVGGLMTHGAVIAREYGLPAVVGVENATRLIKDGQRIRLNGTEGYVELL